MKKTIIALMCLLNTFYAKSQINIVRYNDNFNYLNIDTLHRKNFEKLKFIPFSKCSNISIGGELREQFQYYDHPNFGDLPPNFQKANTVQLMQRIMAHADVKIGSNMRLFAQLGSTFRFFNPNPVAPEIDENKLSLHQLFVDLHFQKNWMLRLGRQEISYGSHRQFTFREGPNTRLAFDAAIVSYHSQNRKLDFFTMFPVISMPEVFDDQSFKDLIIGVYASEKIISKKLSLEYYILNLKTKRRKYDFATGTETRQSYGFRIFSENPKFNYELEATYQTGKFNQSLIRALGISADINYKLNSTNNLIAGIGSNYMSGDRNKDDNFLNTYNLLFSRPQYGLTAPIGATNIININPCIKLSPIKKGTIYLSSYFLWRQSNQDGTYSPSAVEIRPNPTIISSTEKKGIGTLIALESSYSINQHLQLAFDASYFFAGRYPKATGKGKDISYSSFKGTYKF